MIYFRFSTTGETEMRVLLRHSNDGAKDKLP